MFSAEQIEQLVVTRFPDAMARVTDMTGTSDHFELLVVSQAFEGKSLVARHRLVYEALGSVVGAEIHALSLKTLTPAEAERT
jgi:stress-induced morphogen